MSPPVLDEQAAVPAALPATASAVVGVVTFVLYVMAIRRGFLDKYSTLPVFASCANVSWEFIYAFVYPVDHPLRIILYCWLPLNLVLLFQALRYGRKDFRNLSRTGFGWMVGGWFVFAFSFLLLATREFDDRLGVYTTVFVVVLMEALFIVVLRARRSTAGQTMYIALLKTVVDAAGGVGLLALFPDRWLLLQMVVAELVLDVVYLVLLRRQFAAEGARAWRKV